MVTTLAPPNGDVPSRPRALSDRRWWIVVAGVAAVASLPSLTRPLLNTDEATVAVVARSLSRGGSLYRTIADRKPPLVFELYRFVFATTGSADLRPVRVVALFMLAGAIVVAYRVAKRRTRGLYAPLFVLLMVATVASLAPPNSDAAGFELLSLLPLIVAYWGRINRRPWVFGVAAAVAVMTKQPNLLIAVALLAEGYFAIGWRWAWKAAVALAGGLFLLALPFDKTGLIDWVLLWNGSYLGGATFHDVVIGAAGSVGIVALGLFAPTIGFIWALRRRLVDRPLVVWVVSGAITGVLGFRFLPHYFLVAAFPMALGAAPVLCVRSTDTANDSREHKIAHAAVDTEQQPQTSGAKPSTSGVARWLQPAALGMTTLVALVWTIIGLVWAGPVRARDYRQPAKAIDLLTPPRSRILVWGQQSVVYWAADREPATRFPHTGFVTGVSPARTDPRPPGPAFPEAVPLFVDDVTRTPPMLIADTSAHSPHSHYPDILHSPIAGLVRRDYCLVQTVDKVTLWQRRTVAGACPMGPIGPVGPAVGRAGA